MALFGWIVLTIFLLIVGLLLLILLSPIRYEFYFTSEDYRKGHLSIRWLYRLFSLTIAYEEDQELVKEIYILGHMQVGKVRDYDEWLEKRVARELDEGNLEDEGLDVEREASIKRVSFNKDGSIDHTSYASSSAEDNSNSCEEVRGDKQKPDTVASDETQKVLKHLKPDYFWWKPHILNTAFWHQMGRFMRRCYHHSSPRKASIKGRFGVASPYYMGIISGLLYTSWPQAMSQVELDFVENIAKGQIEVKGRIILGVLAWYGLCFVLTKPIRSCIGDGFTFLLQKRKYDKEKLAISEQ